MTMLSEAIASPGLRECALDLYVALQAPLLGMAETAVLP